MSPSAEAPGRRQWGGRGSEGSSALGRGGGQRGEAEQADSDGRPGEPEPWQWLSVDVWSIGGVSGVGPLPGVAVVLFLFAVPYRGRFLFRSRVRRAM